jgi:sulfite exporter TauE/SafE
MTIDIFILMLTASSVGFIHTIFGPDHYLPFIVMAKANKWSDIKTFWITIACGVGHVGSSILLGFIGIGVGLAIAGLEAVESFRGNIAAWMFIAFGLTYFIWGVNRAIKNRPHSHGHFHKNGSYHDHKHSHTIEHQHVHEDKNKNLTPWVLFTIFIFGPCEPLIPLFIYPAAEHNLLAVVLVVTAFTITTIITMLTIVFVSLRGIDFFPQLSLERYMHAIAGGTVFLSGIGIIFLGL